MRFPRLPRSLKSSVASVVSVVGLAVLTASSGVGACGDNPATDQPAVDATAGPQAGLESSTPDAAATDAPTDSPVGDASSLLSPTFVFRDINAILSTGQSLSIGAGGRPVLSVAQPYDNLRFPGGPINASNGLTSFVPLIEEDDETMSSGLANLVTKMAREEVLVGQPADKSSHDILVSVHGVLGVAYAALKKGGTASAYANGIAQAQAGFTLAKAQGKSYVVRAVTNVHGESDHLDGTTNYEADLVQWQSDYESDVKAITGQSDPVPMFHTQFSSWTAYGSATSRIVLDQLAAHVDAPGKIILVGAKYQLPYQPDGIHLSNEGYRQMGEYYAKAYRRVILEGKSWEPVRPRTITRAGAVVTVKMHVPAPPLVIDTTLVSDPGHNGFEWADDGGGATPTITKVAVTAPDTVEVTLSATPSAGNKHLRYAFTGIPNAHAGATTGARGNLRDSDATASLGGYKLYNWAVHFDAPSP